jgi:hypothetical protein
VDYVERLNMDGTSKDQSFTELNVWKETTAFQLFIFNSSKTFHSEEKYKLVDQIINPKQTQSTKQLKQLNKQNQHYKLIN